jgi:hypothetical protein
MSASSLKVNDVVCGIGGIFDKRLGKITKLNPSKPAVEDGSGRRSCYWLENLKRASRFRQFKIWEMFDLQETCRIRQALPLPRHRHTSVPRNY